MSAPFRLSILCCLVLLLAVPQPAVAVFGGLGSAVLGGLATQDFGFTSSAIPPVPCSCAPLALPGDFMIFGYSDKYIPKVYLVNMPKQLATRYTYKAQIAPFTQQTGKVSAIPTVCWVGVYPICTAIYVPNGTIEFSATTVPGAALFRR